MSVVLLRDDFTGSGALAGRTPDGVNSGAWVDDGSYQGAGKSATNTFISGGLLTSPVLHGAWGAQAPLAGTPADAYIEAGIKCAALDGAWTAGIGVRRNGTGAGVFLGLTQYSSNRIQATLNYDGTIVGSPTYAIVIVPSVTSFVARLEANGSSMSVYLNGTLAVTSSLSGASLLPGVAYIDYDGNATTTANAPQFDYIEAGSLFTPPSPPFWTRYQRCFEIDT